MENIKAGIIVTASLMGYGLLMYILYTAIYAMPAAAAGFGHSGGGCPAWMC
jgi:hypothetical protein